MLLERMATEIIAVSIELQRESPCQRTLNIDASLGQIWQWIRKGEGSGIIALELVVVAIKPLKSFINQRVD